MNRAENIGSAVSYPLGLEPVETTLEELKNGDNLSKYCCRSSLIYERKSIQIQASIEECENLLRAINRTSPSMAPDSVDHEPEFQWDLFPTSIYFGNVSQSVYEKYAKPLLSRLVDLDKSLLRWVFVRGYSAKTGSRNCMFAHRDISSFTINIILSSPTEYDGGEFVKLTSTQSEIHRDLSTIGLEHLFRTQFEDGRIQGHKPTMGTAIVVKGDMKGGGELHGVRPVTKGERYVLCAFFDGEMVSPGAGHRT